MTALDLLQSVQFVTVKGKRLAVMGADEWEAMIEWLETLVDTQVAKEACAELRAAGGDRQKAGWLRWDEVREQLNLAATTCLFTLGHGPRSRV